MATATTPRTAWAMAVIPVVAVVAVGLFWFGEPATHVLVLLGLLLVAAVFAAVHHAEVIAARVGEPYGSLVLAVAVTVVEVGMIVTLMLESPDSTQTLARDTIFAALMIICNGIVGLSLLVKSVLRREAVFNPGGVGGALAAIAVLATLTLVFPSLTSSGAGQAFSPFQLTFAAIVSLVLYLVFLFVQTVRHRDYFLPPDRVAVASAHADPPSNRTALASGALLLLALVGVVGLAKLTSPLLKTAIVGAGLPSALVAVSIAMIVLLPESIAAARAAVVGRTQTSLNLAYGSALASIGLTIPAIAVFSLVFGFPVILGLDPSEIVLLGLTLLVSVLTVLPGRATVLQGAVHLCILGSFLAFVIAP